MKNILIALFSLCAFACMDEYSDSFALNEDGSAKFIANIYPCEPDSSIIDNIKSNYQNIEGLTLDSAWFSLKDSLYSLNFKLSFENLLSWQGGKKFEKDLIGNISLKQTDDTTFVFERIINPNAEDENGAIIPEESVSPFAIEQITVSDSSFWEYSIVLPENATLISSDPIPVSLLKWQVKAGDALTKRIVLKASYTLPAPIIQKTHWSSFVGIAVGCIVMLLAIIMLIRKLTKLSVALKELKNAEKKITGE